MLYDCFPFYNELDLLEIRMKELEEVVDRWVIAEATVTHSGQPKPLYFHQDRTRFDRWAGRIIHLVVDDMPGGNDSWRRERHQRNAIARALRGARPEDGVMVSDADEIPRPAAIGHWSPAMGLCRCEQIFSYYWMNCVCGVWWGTRILPYRLLSSYPNLSCIRENGECPILSEAGWHFSYLGGPTHMLAKLRAFAHQDLNRPPFADEAYLARAAAMGADLFGREGMRFRFLPLDARFPRVVLADKARYGHLFREAAFHEDWYSEGQLLRVCDALQSVRSLPGSVFDIGCWEGRSTIALAQTCYPAELLALDSWTGYPDESPDHPTVRLTRERDVFSQFLANVHLLAPDNVRVERRNAHDFLRDWHGPIRFAHLDASHTYQAVRQLIETLQPWMVADGVLCGDDFETADQSRQDLQGGVERAVRESLPAFQQIHNLWLWRKPA